jgi:hypothetical protein
VYSMLECDSDLNVTMCTVWYSVIE